MTYDLVSGEVVITATEFKANPPTATVAVGAVPADSMILDVGPATVAALTAKLAKGAKESPLPLSSEA